MGRTLSLLVLLGSLGIATPLATNCGSTTSCLAMGTLVATPSGSARIETLDVGDFVYSVNPESGELQPAPVIGIRSARQACLALATETGRLVVATAEHPLYVPARGRYVPAGRWLEGPGDEVAVYRDELTRERVAACRQLRTPCVVYDLTVASIFHNFLANGVLVHNKSPGSLPRIGALADHVEIRDDATSARAEPTSPHPTNYNADGLVITLETNPLIVGPGIIRVLAAAPFDALLFEAQTDTGYLEGYSRLGFTVPVTTVDLRVALTGGLEQVNLTMGALVGDVLGPPAFARFPRDP